MYKNIFYYSQLFPKKLSFYAFLTIFTIGYLPVKAQESGVNISFSAVNTTIAHAITTVENQTNLRFVYEGSLNVSKNVRLPKKQITVLDLMAILLKETGCTYQILDNVIIIKKIKKAKETKSVAQYSNVNDAPGSRKRPGGNFSGVVFSSDIQQKIALAIVKITSGSHTYVAETNSEGVFRFTDVEFGLYSLTAYHADYSQSTFDVNVTEKDAREYMIALFPVDKKTKNATLITMQYSDAAVSNQTLLGFDRYGMVQEAPRIALKTNILALATTTFSLGAEVRIGKRLTLDVPVYFNPWRFKNNKQFRQFQVKPELRWWGHEAFNKHYLGVHAIYGMYNVGNLNLPLKIYPSLKDYRYEGHMFGGGISVGHQWILGKRWNLEAALGLGYVFTHYRKKECSVCNDYIEKGDKHYIGPTKTAISLIYVIK